MMMKRFQHPTSNIQHFSGQALVELAVFGSMLLLVMGVLVSYGLNATFTQQAKMASFRRALAESVSLPDPFDADCRGKGTQHVDCPKLGAGNVSLLDDRHVLNPSDPFGIGSMLPFTASASVIRDYEMHVSPDPIDPAGEAALPRQDIVLQGLGVDCPSQGQGCKTQGFRREFGISEDSMERYAEVYGQGRVCWLEKCGATRVCQEYTFEPNPETGELVQICVTFLVDPIVLDPCEGEIINHAGCIKQARMIVDPEECERACRASRPLGESGAECGSICSEPMGQSAWYLQGRYQDGEGQWVFPELEALFTGIKNLGLQPGYVRRNTVNNRLVKAETRTQVSTTTTRSWRQEAARRVVHRQLGSGAARTDADAVRMPRDESRSTTWTTPW